MPNSTFTSAFKTYDYYNYVLNKVQTTYSSKETNLIENDDEITKYIIIISIIFIFSLLFIFIIFCIFIKIYKNCCKNQKIKNRLLISECCRGCCVCLFHKYTASSRIKSERDTIIDSIEIENELPIMIKNTNYIREASSSSDLRGNIIKYLRNFYSNSNYKKKKNKKEELKKNKNNSNSENEWTTRRIKIRNCVSQTQTINSSKSFFTQNESLLLISNLFKENFKDYNDIDLGFLTNDIILTESYLNSETSI